MRWAIYKQRWASEVLAKASPGLILLSPGSPAGCLAELKHKWTRLSLLKSMMNLTKIRFFFHYSCGARVGLNVSFEMSEIVSPHPRPRQPKYRLTTVLSFSALHSCLAPQHHTTLSLKPQAWRCLSPSQPSSVIQKGYFNCNSLFFLCLSCWAGLSCGKVPLYK